MPAPPERVASSAWSPRGLRPGTMAPTVRTRLPLDHRWGTISYHPQSGWFEDTPLKGGTEEGCPLKGVHEGTCLLRLDSVRGTTLALLASHRGIVCRLSVARRIALGAFVWCGKRDSPTRHPLLPLNAGTAEPF